jgi:hypothetical protein
MVSIVAAEADLPFSVEAIVARARAVELVGQVSARLARAGLRGGAHWSLTAAARDADVELKFDVFAPALALLVAAELRAGAAAQVTPRLAIPLSMGSNATARFSSFVRTRV